MKFTFKTEKSTGRYHSFYPNHHYIKLNKKEVGSIDDKPPFRIWFSIYKDAEHNDNNPNCEFINIKLKKESASLTEAKEWLNVNIDAILKKYKLYFFE